ncbi:choice-of-anchor J domain-containing protein [Saccharicrinis sp. FJH62]|uniref:choice-of-anchor J domain-containing protein n=1 Tax=Saccharicrinis sp. FJH62 TaxID=3344657 RepID=UPI0035D43208
MKNYFLLLIVFSLAIVSCEVIDPLREDLNNLNNEFNQNIDYTLTAADYTALHDRILYLDSNDVTVAEFIAANEYFTDEIQGSKYIPMLLDVIMPNLTGTKASVTFNYNGEAPGMLTDIAGMDSYSITHNDYQSIDSTLGYLNYFAPPYLPEHYISNILKHKVKYQGSSDTIVVNYMYSDNEANVVFNKQIIPSLSESFDNGGFGLFSSLDIKGNQSWIYSPRDNGSVTMNGYDGKYFDNEDWLVSPVIDLSDVTNTYLRIKHNVRYFETGCLSLLVTTDIDRSIDSARWSEYAISDPKTAIGVFVNSKLFNLSAYDGNKIKVAFRYISTASSSKAPEWSISEVNVGNYGYPVIGGGYTYQIQDYYAFDSISAKWMPMDNIHRLNRSDYESLGIAEAAFSVASPSQEYLPELADKMYPFAKMDDEVFFVFDYDNGKILTLADKLTKADSGWISTYAYIQQITEPYRNVDSEWRFDPTVILNMEKSDYQIIVDYVNSVPEYAAQNSSTYSNTEYYFGTSAYYPDFDVRIGQYNSSFETWQDAVTTALLEGLLPNKYPNATKYVSGVEVFYYITFKVYSGATQTYTCIFGVSKDAPNPEFYLVDGPTKAE